MKAVVAQRFCQLWPLLLDTAQETGDPAGQVLAELLSELPTAEDMMETLMDWLPTNTVALREVGVIVARWSVSRLAPGLTSERADCLHVLANRLLFVGRPYEALAVAQSCVDEQRRVSPQDELALAQALNTLATCYSDVGEHANALAPAQLAVEHRRRHLEAVSTVDSRVGLAIALITLAYRLLDLDRVETALAVIEEAVKLLAGVSADGHVIHRHRWAEALCARSTVSRRAGRLREAHRDAVGAVDMYRDLDAIRTDAYAPDLAGALNGLALTLDRLGLSEDAEAVAREVVDRYRLLAANRPNVFLPDLSGALNNLANRLATRGALEEAHSLMEEALDIRAAMRDQNPDLYTEDYAISLGNLGLLVSDMGRPGDAMPMLREAVHLARSVAARLPERFHSTLDRTLSALAEAVTTAGNACEAADLRRELIDHLAPTYFGSPARWERWIRFRFAEYLRGARACPRVHDISWADTIRRHLQARRIQRAASSAATRHGP